MSWTSTSRGGAAAAGGGAYSPLGGSKKTAASDAQETDLEAQNDSHLHELHSKISAIRGVTNDIYRDSQQQNTLLDSTNNSFDQFKVSLSNTTGRFARSVQSGKGNGRIQLGIICGFVMLFMVWKFSGSRADKATIPPPTTGTLMRF
ncbi:hypothetical protein MVLG_03164 [Microbotryum lychnidis-dioicae p1A1 Lamole]|uniref:t-SNARE coiled-coil homology domain-containing protein n=1 Tax=Microbotryum lychnidis-dioicae (strain p1A1 Lamole / MvSl-1064) TaxID=683840 RepID=U5H7C9_USTV1|nr:hypothetical protein MVLG_03164 [Microbotryum lychnidis-dioicae p1A1 Lamole]|eukprot:KDE06513.1 hypothetical protein MVLG_03164 [Microbotryum lychnidis-dioicae p1A1 Lamole]